jgi:hypothetical protein
VIIIRHSAVQLTTTANKNQVHYNTVSLAKNCLKRTELLRPHCVGRGSRTSRGPVATSQHLRWGLLGRDGYVPRGPAAGPQYLLYYSCLSTWTNKMWGDFWLKSGEGAQKTTDRGILQQCSLSASVLCAYDVTDLSTWVRQELSIRPTPNDTRAIKMTCCVWLVLISQG